MKKEKVIAFFDRLAESWDERQPRDPEKIGFILDCAGVKSNAFVLDVACGTGILVPWYLQRNVCRVFAVDISPAMIKAAGERIVNERVKFICADAEIYDPHVPVDCCLVYNAFPHFADPFALIKHMADILPVGGTLTVAHSFGREELNRHHAEEAGDVSVGLMPAEELARMFEPYFSPSAVVDETGMYVVSGVKTPYV